MNKFPRILLIFSLTNALASCEIATKLTVEKGDPLKIGMSGSGSLGRLVIRGPRSFRKSLGPDYSAYWCIEPEGRDQVRSIESLSPLSYGVTPKGYKQIYPEQGSAPPPIDEGIYYIHVDTNNAPGASGYFVIRGGKFKFVSSQFELTKEDLGNR
jgi:hypothetical protein